MATETNDAGVDEILSEVQADDYYAIVPEWVLFHTELSHGAVRLYGVLRRFADQRGVAFPGLSAIGEKYGVVPRSVTRHMDELTAAGAVTKKRRIGQNGKVTSNLYRVHSRPTFITVAHDYTPDTTAAVEARRTEMSDGPSDENVRRSTDTSVRRSTDKNVRLTTATLNHTQDEPQGSGALRAPTAETVETSGSNVTSRNASAGAAANELDGDHGDAARAVATPAAILEAMMLNPDEQTRFRGWLVDATNATNPDGLIVSLHSAGRLSERLSQWRTSENPTVPPVAPAAARAAHLVWCGRCDRSTRMATTADAEGREYIRRCPDCNINAGQPAPGSGAAQAIAFEAAVAAATEANGRGRAAFEAARAALPHGVGRRSHTIGDVIPVARVLAESEQSA